MSETGCQFGADDQLVGIVTAPDGVGCGTGCVLINAGLVPKVGPFRLYALWARRLAIDGIVTLRFDLGGIGDSGQEISELTLAERTRRDVSAAVDTLWSRGDLDQIVVGGLCSGAEDALRYAEIDPRVQRVVLIDPFAYRTAGWRWRHLRHRLWRRSLRALGRYRPLPLVTVAGTRPLVDYQYLAQPEARRIIAALLSRGVHLHFVYTNGKSGGINHPDQLAAMFADLDFDGQVTVDLLPWAEHTPVLRPDRDHLVELLAARITSA